MQTSEKEQNRMICPNCQQIIEEITDHFDGCDTWKIKDGNFIKVPKDTIESYAIFDKRCGKKLPTKLAEEVIRMMINTGV